MRLHSWCLYLITRFLDRSGVAEQRVQYKCGGGTGGPSNDMGLRDKHNESSIALRLGTKCEGRMRRADAARVEMEGVAEGLRKDAGLQLRELQGGRGEALAALSAARDAAARAQAQLRMRPLLLVLIRRVEAIGFAQAAAPRMPS